MKKPWIKSLPIAELVEDMELYPRHDVDNSHVTSLVQALESGGTLPPVVADAKSKRISDGWHRVRAQRRFGGADSVIDVELIDYKNEHDLFFDAVRRNSGHGRRLDVIDQTRSVLMLQKHGFSESKIAMALNCTEARVEKLKVKVAYTRSATSESVPGTNTITLKRPVRHLQGRTLTKSQAETHGMLPGTSFLLVSRQLRSALEEGMVDMTDDKLTRELKLLYKQLGKSLG